MAYLPYIRGVSEKIGRLLRDQGFDTTFHSDNKIGSLLRNVKDIIPLESQGVYEIPCGSCNRVYVGQTNRRVSNRVEEHTRSVFREDPKSALFQHVKDTSHRIDFDRAKTVAVEKHLWPRIYREAIEIVKRPDNLNKRDDAKRLPVTWIPALSKYRIEPAEPVSIQASDLLPATTSSNHVSLPEPSVRRVTRSQTLKAKIAETK